MKRWSWQVKLAVALGMLVFLFFVWPTPWIYRGLGDSVLRINRFTGTAYILAHDGWRKMAPKPKPEEPRNLTREAEMDRALAEIRARESGRTVEEELAEIRAHRQ